MFVSSTARTILCVVCLSSFVIAEVSVENNAYQNLWVSFAPNVPSEKGESLVKSLEDLLRNASRSLHTAAGYRLGSVHFHLPASWDTSEWTLDGSEPLVDSPGLADVLVDGTPEGGFGGQPHSRQFGGCGTLGLPVTVPTQFLESYAEGSYPKDKLFVREWLKYRFGVFDENGFSEDPLYPAFYKVPGSEFENRVTECTHPQVEYEVRTSKGDTCLGDTPDISKVCWPQPISENVTDVKSSIMFYHDSLTHLDVVCGRGDHVHRPFTYSKHNILCEDRSVWDVISKSQDHLNYKETAWRDDEDVQFHFHQESAPRVIVAIENTETLSEKIQTIDFATRRLVTDVAGRGQSGVYTFAKEVEEPAVKVFGEGNAEYPLDMEDLLPGTDVCTHCALEKAAEVLLEDNADAKGNIVLITASPYTGEGFEELKDSNLCVSIILFVQEAGSHQTLMDSYKPITDTLSCSSVSTVGMEQDKGLTIDMLHDLMRSHIAFESSLDVLSQTVASGEMTDENVLTFPVHPTAEKYTLWLSRTTALRNVVCKFGDSSVTLEQGLKTQTISSMYFEAPQEQVDISCSLAKKSPNPPLTQIVMETKPGYYFESDLWTLDSTPKDGNQQMPVIIYFRLDFEHYPVRGAKINATVRNGDTEHSIQLFDNGRGDPDITMHDGIYSGYFIDFADSGSQEYTVTVYATGDAEETTTGKKGADRCCGSQVLATEAGQVPMFEVQKTTTFRAEHSKPAEGYPPSRTVDLRAAVNTTSGAIVLTWTAPGGGKADTYTVKSFPSATDAVKNFEQAGRVLQATFEASEHGSQETFAILKFEGFDEKSRQFVALRAHTEHGRSSETSNLAEFFVPILAITTPDPSSSPEPEDNGAGHSPKKTTIIVVSVLAGVVLLAILVYIAVYFICRRKRSRDGDKESGGDGQKRTVVNIPLGGPQLNSIPADVILKHHNEVVTAKNLHKEPPIFNEESLDSFDSAPTPEMTAKNNNNATAAAQYTLVEKRRPNMDELTPQDQAKSPKRMTFV